MKFLCLAYGDAEDWKALTKAEQEEMLAADAVIRDRGALMAAVETKVVTVRAWNGTAEVAEGGVTNLNAPLAGFSVIEAADVNEVIELVAKTPCARAKGAIGSGPSCSSTMSSGEAGIKRLRFWRAIEASSLTAEIFRFQILWFVLRIPLADGSSLRQETRTLDAGMNTG